jgi:hypothetical protein
MNKFGAGALIAALAVAAPAAAKTADGKLNHYSPGKLILYELKDYNGAFYEIQANRTAVALDWNIHSIGINPGERWEVCAKPRFRQPCMVLTESLPDASTVGIFGGIGSARPVPAGN